MGLFVATHSVTGTLLGAFVTGFAGTTLLTVSQAILSDRHGSHRDRALVEANVGAAACAVLTPVILGGLQATAVGWRAAMGLPVLALAWLYPRYRRLPLPANAAAQANSRTRLPAACWYLAALVAVGIPVEFCVIYFGAELLTTTGLSATASAAAAPGRTDHAQRPRPAPRRRPRGHRPYLLGSLADHLGLTAAFTVEPALIVASALLLLAALRAGQAHPGSSPPANAPAA